MLNLQNIEKETYNRWFKGTFDPLVGGHLAFERVT